MKKFFFVILFLFFATNIYAVYEDPSRLFLSTYDGDMLGARAIGMGGAYTAVATTDSVYWNPAGYWNVMDTRLNFMFDMGVASNIGNEVKESRSVERGFFRSASIVSNRTAFSWQRLANYKKLDDKNNEYDVRISKYSISYSRRDYDALQEFMAGCNINYFHGYMGIVDSLKSDALVDVGGGWGLDWGWLYGPQEFRFGAMLQNMPAFMYWEDIGREVIPSVLRLGLSSQILTGAIFSFDYERKYYKGKDDLVLYHVGYEQPLSNSFAIRIGGYGEDFGMSDDMVYTLGLGYKTSRYIYDIATKRYMFDDNFDKKEVYEVVSSISLLL